MEAAAIEASCQSVSNSRLSWLCRRSCSARCREAPCVEALWGVRISAASACAGCTLVKCNCAAVAQPQCCSERAAADSAASLWHWASWLWALAARAVSVRGENTATSTSTAAPSDRATASAAVRDGAAQDEEVSSADDEGAACAHEAIIEQSSDPIWIGASVSWGVSGIMSSSAAFLSSRSLHSATASIQLRELPASLDSTKIAELEIFYVYSY